MPDNLEDDSKPSGNESMMANGRGEHPSENEPPAVEINWDGDDRNPYNWSMTKRVYHTVLIGLFGFTVYVSETNFDFPKIPPLISASAGHLHRLCIHQRYPRL